VLGFVGAGGLGQELVISIRQFASSEVFSIILVFIALVWLADAMSAMLRRRVGNTSRSAPTKHTWWTTPHTLSVVGIFIVTVVSFFFIDWQFEQWFKASSIMRTQEFLLGFMPPDLSMALWERLAASTLETLSMAVAGTALACVFALLISYLMFVIQLKGSSLFLRAFIRAIHGIQIVLRSVPELVWAMLLIIVVGIGAFTGTLALLLSSLGVMSRLYSECLENQDTRALDNLRANGTSALVAPLWSTLIQARSQLLSYSLYRWEHNLRAATLMGIVGAAGVGQELYLRLSVFQFDKVAACIVVIVAMVALADSVSYFLRHQFAAQG